MDNNKPDFEAPVMKVVKVEHTDIVTTSDTPEPEPP